jgi:hypothetical protein
MNFNLFTWVREGIKQSILLGVSDAIETIGAPDNSDEISPRLLDYLRQGGHEADGDAKRNATASARKRLGRSLKDIEAEAAAS